MKNEKKIGFIGRNKIIFFILFLTTVFISSNAQTNMFMGNAQHTGSYSSPELTNGIGTKWTFKTNGPIVGSPLIAGGKIYIGSWDSCLYAINKSGELVWKNKTGGKICSTPAVVNNMVYFISFDGFFYALDTTSGDIKWKFQTRGERLRGEKGLYDYQPITNMHYDSYDPYLSSAVVVDTLVVFGCGDSSIYCLHANTGDMIWQFKTGHVVHSSPAYYNQKIYCGGFDCKLYALNIHTGEKIWQAVVGHTGTDSYSGNISSPSVSDGFVYIGSKDNYLAAFDAETGTQKFKYSTPGIWVVSTPAISNGRVVAGNSGMNRIFAISSENGGHIFNNPLEALGYGVWTWTSAAISGDIYYLGSLNGRMYAIDAAGNILWRYRTKGCIENKHNFLRFDGSRNDDILKGLNFGIQKGNDDVMLWGLESGGILGNAVPDDGVLYFGSGDGYLYAVTDGFTSFSFDGSLINFGTISERTIFDTTIYITNTSEHDDSINIFFDPAFSEDLWAGFSLPFTSFEIKKGEKVSIPVTINTNELTNKSYSASLVFESKKSPESGFFYKKIVWRFKEQPSDIHENFRSNIRVFPNPLTNHVTFEYTTEKYGYVSLGVFDINGSKVTEIVNELQTAGEHNIRWEISERMSPGTYYYVLTTDENSVTGKLIKK
jgi:eukaryotic-like serine/threonine-protein kinase